MQLPPGATLAAHARGAARSVDHDASARTPPSTTVLLVTGSSFTGNGENVGSAFIQLKPWDQRKTSAAEFIAWANRTFAREIHDARVFVINLPTIRGLGQFGGFDFYPGGSRRRSAARRSTAAQDTMLQRPPADPVLTGVRVNTLQRRAAPATHASIACRRSRWACPSSDVYTAIQLMLAPVYANDFIYQGRVLRVLLQADAPYRMTPRTSALLREHHSPVRLRPGTAAIRRA